MLLNCVNAIFDLDLLPWLELAHGFLDDIWVIFFGRCGDWGYIWTDESLSAAKELEKLP